MADELFNHYQKGIAEFAERVNLSYEQVLELLNGDLFISDELAQKLVHVMGNTAFNLETNKNGYRASLDRLQPIIPMNEVDGLLILE